MDNTTDNTTAAPTESARGHVAGSVGNLSAGCPASTDTTAAPTTDSADARYARYLAVLELRRLAHEQRDTSADAITLVRYMYELRAGRAI